MDRDRFNRVTGVLLAAGGTACSFPVEDYLAAVDDHLDPESAEALRRCARSLNVFKQQVRRFVDGPPPSTTHHPQED